MDIQEAFKDLRARKEEFEKSEGGCSLRRRWIREEPQA
jgi:hypothetical protein